MTATGILYIFGAAYLAGISSAIWVFGLFIRAVKGTDQKASCVVRGASVAIFLLAVLLFLNGWQLLAQAGALIY